jgi:hypothetical protein
MRVLSIWEYVSASDPLGKEGGGDVGQKGSHAPWLSGLGEEVQESRRQGVIRISIPDNLPLSTDEA